MDDIFEYIWHGVGITVVLSAAIFLGSLTVAQKKVDGYYLSRAGGSSVATCVYAHWTWHVDEQAFCTNDNNEALDFVERANKTIR